MPPEDLNDRSRPMMALGLIETIGAIGGIEAADAALKAARVRLVGKEYADAGLHLIKVIGEVAAVRAAVEAGAEAAKRCGQLVGTHVIPRPDLALEQWIFAKHTDPKALAFTASPRIGPHPVERPIATTRGNAEPPLGVDIPPTPPPPHPMVLPDNWADLPVRELRAAVRGLSGFPLQGRAVSQANREQLVEAIREWQEKQ
ncbi:MAG TPA: BMC domain-containing protein [bacterium]|nr:BMC domain-containing protein [bacterium]